MGFFGLLITKILNFFLGILLKLIEKKDKCWISIQKRPKYSLNFGGFSDVRKNQRNCAIIIQGPLNNFNSFTVETVRIYKKIFPQCHIIVSTWKDENKKELNKLKEEDIIIIENSKPDFPGPLNINYQIVSSREGLKYAQKIGVKYALKTRTDQRVYAQNTIDYLIEILSTFPITHILNQNSRLIGTSFITFKYRPYGISDMFLFGDISDMLIYWDAPLDNQEYSGNKPNHTLRDLLISNCPEVYLMINYLKRINRPIEGTLLDSWKAFAEHFCVIDHESIDLFWLKYDRFNANYGYDAIRTTAIMSFREWLILYTNSYEQHNVPEYVLDKIEGESII
jgi:hypothetical protein